MNVEIDGVAYVPLTEAPGIEAIAKTLLRAYFDDDIVNGAEFSPTLGELLKAIAGEPCASGG